MGVNKYEVVASRAQKRIWYFEQKHPKTAVYHIPIEINMIGELKVTLLWKALNDVIQCNEPLRTGLIEKNGILYQIIFEEIKLNEDIDIVSDRKEYEKLREEAVNQPFDLSNAPLLRIRLFKFENEYRLLLVFHHIMMDGWSISLFMKELASAYNGYCKNQASILEMPELQYADYAAWYEEWLDDGERDRTKVFWDKMFQDGYEKLEVNYPVQQKNENIFLSGYEEIMLHDNLTEKLEDFISKGYGSTFSIFLSTFLGTLSYITGKDRVMVETVTSGRVNGDLMDMMGFFVNNVPVQTNIHNKSFAALVHELNRLSLLLNDNQAFPYDEIVTNYIAEKYKQDYTPFSDFIFLLQDMKIPNTIFDGVDITVANKNDGLAKNDFTLMVDKEGRNYKLCVNYAVYKYDKGFVLRFLDIMVRLLSTYLEVPEAKLDSVSPYELEDFRKQLAAINPLEEVEVKQTAYELIENSISIHSDNVLIQQNGEIVTYEKMSQYADYILEKMLEEKIVSGSRVAVITDRNDKFLYSILAVWRNDCTYVPLDLSLPIERVKGILKEAQVSCILYDASVFKISDISVEGIPDIDVSHLVASTNKITHKKAVNAAYVLYTSGSTGVPKGVVISQKALGNYLSHCIENYFIYDNMVSLFHTSISFDLTITSIMPQLVQGGQIHYIEYSRGIPGLLEFIKENQRALLLKCTPAHLEILFQSIDKEFFINQQIMAIVGGEEVTRKLVGDFYENMPKSVMINEYGPTEATVGCTICRLTEEMCYANHMSIGYSISGMASYVVNARNQILPPYFSGELILSGNGLADEYFHNMPETKAKFIDNVIDGKRVYRTGDYCFYDEKGNLYYIGRTDGQLKIRGFRVEIEEIESTFQSLYQDIPLKVLSIQNENKRPELCGFYQSKEEINQKEFKTNLGKTLPSYMIPAYFMRIDRVPINQNGKVDVKLLVQMFQEWKKQQVEDEDYQPTQTEEELYAIWSKLLGRNNLSYDSDFFEEGGHSLLAVQLVNQVNEKYHSEFTLKDIFSNPVLNSFAQMIDQRTVDTADELKQFSKEENIPSIGQERLWFLNQLEEDNPFYNVVFTVQLTGKLDIKKLEQVISKVFDRHSVFHYSYHEDEEGKLIVKDNAITAGLDTITIEDKSLSKDDVLAFVMEESKRFGNIPFNLTKAPLARTKLIHVKDDLNFLLFSIHHIICDGWSMGILLEDIKRFYLDDEKTSLQDEILPYNVFAQYQKFKNEQDDLKKQIDWWHNQLNNSLPVLMMPTTYKRPNIMSYRGKHIRALSSQDLLKDIKLCAKELKVTEFYVLYAAYVIMLWKYSEQEDYVIGVPFANREKSAFEKIVGYFVNVLPVLTHINESMTVKELIEGCKESFLMVHQNKDVPIEILLKDYENRSDLSRPPLYQTMFTLQNAPLGEMSIGTIELNPMFIESDTCKMDLSLMAEETNGSYQFVLEYCTDLFSKEFMQRFMTNYLYVLKQMKDYDKKLEYIEAISPDEKNYLLNEFNSNIKNFNNELTIDQLIDRWAGVNPNKIAFSDEQNTITYLQLKEETDRLSSRLISEADKKAPILIYMDREIDFVKTIISLWKCGMSYIPLEVNYPFERVEEMIHRSGAQIVVVNAESEAAWDDRHSIKTINMNNRIVPSNLKCDLYGGKLGLDDLVYTIFTSGSTGKPKGAMIEQKGMLNHLFAKIDYLNITENDFIIENASQCFDISIWQFFSNVIAGGRCHIVSDETAKNPRALLKTVAEYGCTILEIVPMVLRFILDDEICLKYLMECKKLRVLVLTGEALPTDIVNRWHALENGIPILNAYGPTECSDDVTHYMSKEAFDERVVNMPIGTPLPNVSLYVMNKKQQLVPRGVPGELYVGGIAVGKGYLNAEQETNRAFLENPFTGEKRKFYRTGDLVVINEEGQLVFNGRIDFQVKIRGYRIELKEIENVFLQYENVTNCVVVGKQDKKNETQLVLYYASNAEIKAEAIKSYLLQYLPAYMIPIAFIRLEQLPTSHNGKIDLKQLPEPVFDEVEEIDDDQELTENEKKLADIWKELIGCDAGKHSNFFSMGGHSLVAVQLLSKIEKQFKKKITLHDIFANPELDKMSLLVEHAEDKTLFPAIRGFSSNKQPEISFGQERMAFYEYVHPNTEMFNIPGVFEITGNLNLKNLEEAINKVINKHDVLRTNIIFLSGIPTVVLQDKMNVKLEYEVLENVSVKAKRIDNFISKAFRIDIDPLLRFKVLEVDKNKYTLIAVIHHLVIDGWSINLLMREIMNSMYEIDKGIESDVPMNEEAISYYDYAAWQKQLYKEGRFEDDLNFWMKKLDAHQDCTYFESSYDDYMMREDAEDIMVVHDMDDAVVTAMNKMCNENNVSIFDIMLGNLFSYIYKIVKREEITIGIPFAGRDQEELEDIIGCFINILPIRVNMSKCEKFTQLVVQVSEEVADAIEHSHIPFEKIVEEVLPNREYGNTPLFNIFFNMLRFPDMGKEEALEKAGIQIEESGYIYGVQSKFDFTFYVKEKNNKFMIYSVFKGSRFTRERAESIVTQYLELLSGNLGFISSQPSKDGKEGKGEVIKLQADYDWNVWERFNAIADCHSNEIAIATPEKKYTYQECKEEKNKLCKYMVDNLKEEEIVAFYSDRNAQLPIICLAAMETGHPFTIISDEYPDAVVNERINVVKPAIVVNISKTECNVDSCQVIKLNTIFENYKDGNYVPKYKKSGFNTPSYITFTSGTTGRPKAIITNQGAISHFIKWYINEFNYNKGLKFSMLSGLSHDPIYRDIFTPLCCGATLCIPEGISLLDIKEVESWLRTEKVNVIHTTPSYCQILTHISDLSDVEKIFTGGETLKRGLYEKITLQMPKAKVYSFYGCTETPQGMLLKQFSNETENFYALGSPIEGVLTAVIDPDTKEVCKEGEIGEICIISHYISPGYYGEDNASSFITWSDKSGNEIPAYRTGDRGWLNECNEIIYMGRQDRQVKIRGYRVELGTVETIIMENKAVKQCVCIATKQDPVSIHAFVVLEDENQISIKSLQNDVAERCPAYMMPTSMNFIEHIPITANGKVDENGLLTMIQDSEKVEKIDRELTDIDISLMHIWSDILQREPDLNSDFFSLGGHSLKAVQLIIRLEEQYGIQVTAKEVFENRVFHEMSELIENKLEEFVESLSEEEVLAYLEKMQEQE
ncbi:MAG TPA: hypothetical protein DCW90_10675 [Lachnospiraceae bacterium]|nr:hypothetical protein [Lachnospiraceae bacterium]